MENNKLIIGVRFSFSSDEHSIYTFSVLRDITLKQLLDGLKYGFEKKLNAATGEAEKSTLTEILNLLSIPPDEQKRYLHIKLFRYQEHLAREYIQKVGREHRVVFCECHLQKKLCDIGFVTSTELAFINPDCVKDEKKNEKSVHPKFGTSHVIQPFHPGKSIEYKFPEYNISTRERYCFNKEAVRIIPPSDPPTKPKGNVISGMLPSIVTMAVMMLARSSTSGFDKSMLITTIVMALASVFGGILMNRNQQKEYKGSLKKWRLEYQAYINRTWSEILERQSKDAERLDALYPDADLLATDTGRGIYSYNEHIFSRSRNDDDFLTFRLGLSANVESLFEVEGESKDVVFSAANYTIDPSHKKTPIQLHLNGEATRGTANNLCKLPGDLKERCRYMPDAPLLYSLKNSGALGIVDARVHDIRGEVKKHKIENGANYLIKRMIFDLCFHHSPEDLQFVIFFQNGMLDKKTPADTHAMMDCIEDYRYLPHFRGLFADKSQFVFDPASASAVLSQTMSILSERTKNSGSKDEEQKNRAPKYPHIVFIVFDEYNMKEHAFAQYLPKVPEEGKSFENELGISFVFAVQHKEYLPAYCTDVVRVNDKGMTLTPRDNQGNVKLFRCPEYNGGEMSAKVGDKYWDRYKRAFEFFSAIYFTKIAENGKVPSNVNMFELMDATGVDLDGYIEGKWVQVDVTKSLQVPIGKTESGIAYLDLHEKADGPHMLVAGTTGSGKSETVISWLLGLCMYFKPEELNLLLVDMKGGGFTKRLGNLPHVVGTVTDVDGDENGTGAEYMLRRFLDAMTAEVKRRKILLNKMHVDNVDDYIKACRNIESHIKSKNIPPKEQDEVKRIANDEKLSHLILVVDEFTELKRFSSENSDIDFIGQITTIARVGRSLGYHICLISQNIQGAITEDISVNSKSRLCLKVATRQASKEMIGNELAAAPSMPGCGRAYLLVGTGSKFEYFQSAYSGSKILSSDADRDEAGLNDMAFQITELVPSGDYTVFYQSDKDNTQVDKRMKELSEQGKLQSQLEAITASIERVYKKNKVSLSRPHKVFQEPLPTCIALGVDGKPVSVKEEDLGGVQHGT